MRKPKLTIDAFVAALAVLAPLAQGCSKADRAAAEPAAATPQTGAKAVEPTPGPEATTIAPPSPVAPIAPVEGTLPAQQPVRGAAATAIDAGKEMKKAAPKGGAQAACGAAGCSPDMKKER